MKELKERVTELEERNKRGKESVTILKKSDVCESSERDSKDWCRMLPDIEARVMENEVLIEIHCEKEEGVELKLLDHLENLHLCVTATSVLPFGNSTLGITIIAQVYTFTQRFMLQVNLCTTISLFSFMGCRWVTRTR